MPTTIEPESVRAHVLRSMPHFLIALVLVLGGCLIVRQAISKEIIRDRHYLLAKATAESLSGHAVADFARGGPMLERLVNSPDPEWLPDYRPAGWEKLDITTRPTLDWRIVNFDSARALNAAIPDSLDPLHAVQPFVLHASGSEYVRAVDCLAAAVHYEAANEPLEGQEAVAQVVLNRVRTPGYPKSVCGVVFQGSERPGCQFSFACDGSMARIPAAWSWKNAQAVATRALNGFVLSKVGNATHYHATYVLPWWSPTLVKLGRIGQHVFYRPTGPAFFAPYRGGELSITKANYIGKAQPGLLPAGPGSDPVAQLANLTTTPDGRVHATIMAPSQITASNVPMVDGVAVMPTVHALISARAAYARAQMEKRQAGAAVSPTPTAAVPARPAPSVVSVASAAL